ncbi:MAG: hypothetical protein RI894_1869 [Bacteroidota bacterium]|jgi:hypothetical protein
MLNIQKMIRIKKLLSICFLLGAAFFAKAQTALVMLETTVLDENKEPLAGAVIFTKIVGKLHRNITNLDGKCQVQPVDSLTVACGGYKTVVISAEAVKKNPIIQLQLSNKSLSAKKMQLKPVPISEKVIENSNADYAVTYFDDRGVETETVARESTRVPETTTEAYTAPKPVYETSKVVEGKATTAPKGTTAAWDKGSESGVKTSSAPASGKSGSRKMEAEAVRSAPYLATHDAPPPPARSVEVLSTVKTKKERKAMSEKSVKRLSDSRTAAFVALEKGEDKPALPAEKVKAHLLTVGEVNDFTKWTMWKDIALTQLEEHRKAWDIMPMQRYTVQLQTENGYPIVDAAVQLMENDSAVWAARTDNTGKAEMWLDAFERPVSERSELALKVSYQGKKYDFATVKRFQKGINIFKLPAKCDIPTKIDVAFVVDATGSMGDEIDYLKAELSDIAMRVNDSLRSSQLRLGTVFYKDKGDEYLTMFSDFDKKIQKTADFVAQRSAGGGGDFPEAVDDALEATLRDLKWSENAAARIAFLILDAPPHNTPQIKARLERSIRQFAERGIRLIPVACSGTDKSTEYLMRSFALLTNGTYLALTDDSGIGETHIKPTTDKMSVEFLNDAMVRLIMQFSKTPSCNEQLPAKIAQRDTVKAILPDTSQVKDPKKQPYAFPVYKIFPNPTAGMVYLDTDGSVGNIYLCDMNGKILSQIAIGGRPRMQFDLTDYPAGVYLLRYEYAPDKWLTSKIVKVRN